MMPLAVQYELIHDHRRGVGPTIVSAERASLSAPHALADSSLVSQTLDVLKKDVEPGPREQLKSFVEATLGRVNKPLDSDDDSAERTAGLEADDTALQLYPYEIVCLNPIHGGRPFVITITGDDSDIPQND